MNIRKEEGSPNENSDDTQKSKSDKIINPKF